jgi:hypothetical protein
MGHVLDCDAALVQRARIRVFADGTELLTSPFGTPITTYGNGTGFPTGRGDETSGDGLFLALAQGTSNLRVEAWGRFEIDGAEHLLSCTSGSVATGLPITVDLGPLASDAPSDCGSVAP